ncbi:MAG: asparaginase [Endomicrobiaceae bacterium]|nr:asparaginase [Endomicrobiaceae bacterium]
MNKKIIRIIYTGGTIGGREKSSETIVSDLKTDKFETCLFNKLPDNIIEDENTKVEIVAAQINKFSEEMTPTDWGLIATAINNAIEDGVQGIVVAHGTDTMAYTTSAISYMLQGIKIPVAITGSNKPIVDNETDAVKNLEDAIIFVKKNLFPGIFLVFSGEIERNSLIHLGTRVRKVRFSNNCYESVNTAPIGMIKRNFWNNSIKIINYNVLNKFIKLNNSKEYNFNNKIDSRVSLFKIYPGFDPSIIKNCIEQKEIKGIILELYASGTGCTNTLSYSLIPSIILAGKYGIPIFAISQHVGVMNMNSYGSAERLKNAGVIPLHDMITEAALPKLMWVLGQTKDTKEITKLMLTSLSGEITL